MPRCYQARHAINRKMEKCSAKKVFTWLLTSQLAPACFRRQMTAFGMNGSEESYFCATDTHLFHLSVILFGLERLARKLERTARRTFQRTQGV